MLHLMYASEIGTKKIGEILNNLNSSGKVSSLEKTIQAFLSKYGIVLSSGQLSALYVIAPLAMIVLSRKFGYSLSGSLIIAGLLGMGGFLLKTQ